MSFWIEPMELVEPLWAAKDPLVVVPYRVVCSTGDSASLQLSRAVRETKAQLLHCEVSCAGTDKGGRT